MFTAFEIDGGLVPQWDEYNTLQAAQMIPTNPTISKDSDMIYYEVL